jgi:hypothetical protein
MSILIGATPTTSIIATTFPFLPSRSGRPPLLSPHIAPLIHAFKLLKGILIHIYVRGISLPLS